MKEELVSIISPVHNGQEFLARAIESVINQTYTNWELILIDDCSSDDSIIILDEFKTKDKRIITKHLTVNVGAGEARNVGLEMASGTFTAFLDSDDYWHPTKLEKQIAFMQKFEYSFTYTWYHCVNEYETILSFFRTPKKISLNLLRFNNYILTSTVICRSNILKSIRFHKMRKRQDWIFFLDILKVTGNAYSLNESLTFYRKSSNSLSSNKLSLIKPNFIMFRDYFYSGNKWRSILHFCAFLPFYFHNKIFNKH